MAITVALAMTAPRAFAADRGHARAGVIAGFTSSSSNAKRWDANSMGRYHFGLTAQLPIALGFAIQPSVVYQAKGTKLNGKAETNSSENVPTMDTKVSYIEVPVQVQWGPDLMVLRPFVFVEPFVGYGLKSKTKSMSESGDHYVNNSFKKSGLARWEYGASLGAGIDVWKLQATIKYYWNFGSLYNESGKMSNIGSQIKDAFKDGRNFNGVTISVAFMF